MKEHMTPHNLERYSFQWSEARLVIASVALFLGGFPPALFFIRIPAFYGLVYSLLGLAWIISGAAAVYMLYRWNGNGKKVFGGNNDHDMYAFWITVVSGLNLGYAGISSSNIGLSITHNRLILFVVGLAYLWSANHLYKRWKEHGEKIF